MFSTGLVWFFVQAWIFAIQARTIWLIVLLTITTTVAILSQGYLCAIFVSIPPVSATKTVLTAVSTYYINGLNGTGENRGRVEAKQKSPPAGLC